jgi:hypothetical protein
MTTKIRYNNEFLQQFCKENGIELTKDYSLEKVNRETVIEAKCLTEGCHDICSKGFRYITRNSCYCYCEKHTAEIKQTNTKQTCLNKYGVEHNSQNELIKKKKVETCLKNYGVEHPVQNEGVKHKIKKSCLEKYGVEYSLQSKEMREKSKQTCLEKYGVEYSSQDPTISEKQSKNAYKSYDYIFPSGRVERIQGYENYMLNDLLQKENVLEDDIVVNRGKVPSIWYEDSNGKKRRYFVDCFIKSQNRCIETKSSWTAAKKKDCIYLKQNALKDAGYLCEIWIYNGKGELVEKVL